MSDELPIYSEGALRSGVQFAALDGLKGNDDLAVWEKADRLIAEMEGAGNVHAARKALTDLSRDRLLRTHFILFQDRANAGAFRTVHAEPRYRGQDCAPPQFIEQSLDRFSEWLSADSFMQIHPIEKCALVITRLLDIWPFEFGNFTTALVFGNSLLGQAGFTPFFVQPQHVREFEGVVARAMSIDMQPLVNAIHNTVRREMEAIAK